VYVSLVATDATAKNYALKTGTHTVKNQTILRAPQKILFPNTDTTIYVRDGKFTLMAIDSTGGAPPLPVSFRLTPDGTQDAELESNNELTPRQPGTVYVTAYIEPNSNPNYDTAAPVRRKFTVTDRDSCTVTFNTGNACPSILAVKVAKADTVGKPADPSCNNLAFGGWYADEGYKSEWHFSEHRVRQDTTIHARWGYTITFSANGGSLGSGNSKGDTVVVYGGTVAKPANPTQRGYGFKGWYTDSISYTHRWNFSGDIVRSNATLYAKWDTIRYSISYKNLNSGKNHADNPDTFTVATPTIALQPAALMGDSIFAGWYNNSNLNGSPVSEIQGGSIGSRELWAKWKDTSCCSGIANVNCPDFPYYDSPANVYPYYFDVGGGGDTGCCGNGVLNLYCPFYPGYYLPGGGTNNIRHEIDSFTYDDDFHLLETKPEDDAAFGGQAFEWISLTPEVATVDDVGYVSIAKCGRASMLCRTQQGKRVVISVTLHIAPKPLDIVGTWVDTIKIYDAKPDAGVVAGVLQGVLERDADSLSVTPAASFDSHHTGSGKRIVERYTLTGSRACCYVAPQNDTLTGSVIPDDKEDKEDRYRDIWGMVMKREEAGNAASPYAGVSVAYAINGTPAGTALTDDYGRYFIGGLGDGDAVTLHPEEKRTWMVTPSQQTITEKSNVEQAEPFIYVPDTVSLRALTLRDAADEEFVRWEREQITDTTYYPLPCSYSADTLSVGYTLPPGVSDSVTDDTGKVVSQPLSNQIQVDVSKPGRKAFSINLSSGERYTVAVEKSPGLFDIVTENLWGHIRIVINNPAITGNPKFDVCTWRYKKYDKYGEEDWETKSGTKFYYTAGPSTTDKFDPRDSMSVILSTKDGYTLETCPDDLQSRAAAVGQSEEDVSDYAYPNPVAGGNKIYLKRSIITDGNGDDEGGDDGDGDGEGEVRYSTYRLFNSVGKLVSGGSASMLTGGLVMPKIVGAYFLILDGKAGRRVIRVVVF
jgi:uncharacterized repeat protein (TIGR02543 family)